MSNELTKEQKEELQKIADEITNTAKDLVEDYVKNPSEHSGSVHPTEGKVRGHGAVIGLDSQYLKDEWVTNEKKSDKEDSNKE